MNSLNSNNQKVLNFNQARKAFELFIAKYIKGQLSINDLLAACANEFNLKNYYVLNSGLQLCHNDNFETCRDFLTQQSNVFITDVDFQVLDCDNTEEKCIYVLNACMGLNDTYPLSMLNGIDSKKDLSHLFKAEPIDFEIAFIIDKELNEKGFLVSLDYICFEHTGSNASLLLWAIANKIDLSLLFQTPYAVFSKFENNKYHNLFVYEEDDNDIDEVILANMKALYWDDFVDFKNKKMM